MKLALLHAFQIVLYLCIGILFNSCNFDQNCPNCIGGVVFSFDDDHIEEWFTYKDLLKKYGIKATFCITRPHLLSEPELKKLRQLQLEGHEIACHSYDHVDATNYLDSLDTYMDKQIHRARHILETNGFELESFAYPFGTSHPKIDSLLTNEFKYLRKATWNEKEQSISLYDEIYASRAHHHIVNSMGIDVNYKIPLDDLEVGLLRAKNRNEVLILYAHKINDKQTDYTISARYLEEAFRLCKKHDIKTIRLKDLDSFFVANDSHL